MRARLVFEWICRLIAGSVFIYASLNKIADPCGMAVDIYQYRILPGFLVNISAILLPVTELILGMALIIGLGSRGAALGITGLLCIFILALSFNLIRGIDMECGCFGSAKDLCVAFSGWIAGNHPGITPLSKIRIRLGCDVLRDIFFLTASIGALLLLHQRANSHSGSSAENTD